MPRRHSRCPPAAHNFRDRRGFPPERMPPQIGLCGQFASSGMTRRETQISDGGTGAAAERRTFVSPLIPANAAAMFTHNRRLLPRNYMLYSNLEVA